MAFRGYVALNGVEIANSSRVVAHLGTKTPTLDAAVFGTVGGCGLTPSGDGLFAIPDTSAEVDDGLYTPPDGSRRADDGLLEVTDECWSGRNLCGRCAPTIGYDDSWPGLQDYLQDAVYLPELAPWYSTRIPESGEFGGIWLMSIDGLGPGPIDRPLTELVGSGAAAGRHRDPSRPVTFEALLIACTNAGLEYGIEWLACQLRDTKARTDSVMRFFQAHPSHTAADPDSLIREVHGVVYTKAIEVSESICPTGTPNNQALMYRINWQMTVLHPYVYSPAIDVPVVWDEIAIEPIRWVHGPDCPTTPDCSDLPVLFSTECVPERITTVTDPPPVCGGCMPVCAVDTYVYQLPVFDYPYRCGETAVTAIFTNLGERALTVQSWLRRCDPLSGCDDHLWPTQISGLPPTAELTLDGISGRYTAFYDGRNRRPVGIVSTPSGAPWRPPVIDRRECYELVVVAPGDAEFDVVLSLADRGA